MKLKIDVADLRTGMYVCELDRPWLESPFLFQGFPIHNAGEIARLQAFSRFVYVDPERSVPGVLNHCRILGELHTDTDDERAKRAKLTADANGGEVGDYQAQLKQAWFVRDTAHDYLKQAMEDIRLGKGVDAPGARTIVTSLVSEVMNNVNTMLWLTQLKNVDEYTSIHSLNVCIMSLAFGRCMGLGPNELHVLGLGALLHDIGKMHVPLDILNKPGPLSEQEFELIKQHPVSGYKVLEPEKNHIPPQALQIVKSHHERNDGSGYTESLDSEVIPRFVKLVSIVDVYDAVTSDRSYHKAETPQDAMSMIFKTAPQGFDRDLVEAFIKCVGIYPVGSIVELNTGQVGVLVGHTPGKKLRPMVLIVRGADGQMCKLRKLLNLGSPSWDNNPKAPRIMRMLEPGTYGIDPGTVLRAQLGIGK